MRRDIQLLRGIAVLLVVIYHANLNIFNQGYLGVDVFFVLSGFLISKIILEGLASGEFSFIKFYIRRAKRLLPALYCTLIITGTFASQLLTPKQFLDFIAQFVGAITFSSNMVLPTQIGYFADGAESKPLLHIWSLSLEEQYYFTLPLFLFLIKKEWRLTGLVIAFFVSIIWCFTWATNSGSPPFLWRFSDVSINEWAFFLFPSRAWELLVGSICAWIMLQQREFKIRPFLKWLSLIVIFISSTLGFDSIHPRGDALLVVIATALLVLGDDKWLPRAKISSGIEKIGDWSYSIYLIHWPLFAFAFVVFLDQVPVEVNTILVGVSIVGGYLQFRYIETPFRYHWNHPSNYIWRRFAVATLILLVSPLAALGYSSVSVEKNNSIDDIRKRNYGLSEECNGSFLDGKINKVCILGNNPRLAVWGDSYAMHLIPGIAVKNKNFVQLTKSVCGPFLGLAPIQGKYNKAWADGCIAHNENSFEFIKNSDSITHVVLSSTFDQYFGEKKGQFLIGSEAVEKNQELAFIYLTQTIDQLKKAGKQVILISPPPRSGFNIGSCLEREDLNLMTVRKGCDIDMEEYLRMDRIINEALSAVSSETNTKIIWLKDLLCKEGRCQSRLGGKYVYRDEGHLSIDGSKAILGKLEFEVTPNPIQNYKISPVIFSTLN